MLGKRKRKEPVSRSIPSEDLSDFEAPDLSGVKPLTDTDTKAIKGLVSEFLETGVVSRVTSYSDARQSLNDVSEIFKEATSVAKYENELNPTKYSEELEGFLADKSESEGDTHDLKPFTDNYFDDEESEERFI